MGRFRYKQLILLLGILILPSIAIGLLGWRDFTRERERRSKESAERVKDEVRLAVLKALNDVMVLEISGKPAGNALVFTGRVQKDGLAFPWESDRAAGVARESLNAPEFQRSVIEAGRAENIHGRDDLAANLFRELIQNAKTESQRLTARSLLAGTLVRSGQAAARTEALGIWRDLLKRPVGDVNEFGIPFAYIAAGALAPTEAGDVLDRIAADPEFPSMVSPTGAQVLPPVLETLTGSSDAKIAARASEVLEELSVRVAFLERAEAFKKEFPDRFSLTPSDWRAYPPPPAAAGADVWMMSVTQETPPRVIAVRAVDIIQQAVSERRPRDGDPLFEVTSGGAGEPLGENLPDLRIALHPAAPPNVWSAMLSAQPAYALALCSVLLLTFVGGYLLWRDTRREIRLADLRTQFVASVSHELKTPLTAIRMFAELMQLQTPVADAKKRHEHLDAIVSESERLSRLLNNVMEFSRIDRGQKTYHLEPAALPEVVETAARAMRFPLAQKGFRFHVDIASEIPHANVDRDAIEQAVLNLLSNAMKYSGESRDIALRLFRENGDAAIQVSDQGVGIPAEEHSRIFERFYRVSTPENLAVSGTGLGLAIVAHIADAHGGRIHVESAVGFGSTFTMRIPLVGTSHHGAEKT